MAPRDTHQAEVQVAKSPAEFFAENQAIAGFDNMGKSLYTTLRELIGKMYSGVGTEGLALALSDTFSLHI